MSSKLLRTTAIALVGFGLATAPAAFAQTTTDPAQTPMDAAPAPGGDTLPGTPSTGAAPAEKISPDPVQDNAAAAPAMPDTATVTSNMQPTGTVLAEDLKSAKVTSPAGEDIASVSDLVVEPTGAIKGAVLSVGGVLGVGGKEILVPWEEITVGADGETLVLAMSEQQIEAMPAFQPLPKEEDTTSAVPAPTPTPAQPAAPAD